MDLNAREYSIVFWLAVGLAVALYKSEGQLGLDKFLKPLTQPILLEYFALLGVLVI